MSSRITSAAVRPCLLNARRQERPRSASARSDFAELSAACGAGPDPALHRGSDGGGHRRCVDTRDLDRHPADSRRTAALIARWSTHGWSAATLQWAGQRRRLRAQLTRGPSDGRKRLAASTSRPAGKCLPFPGIIPPSLHSVQDPMLRATNSSRKRPFSVACEFKRTIESSVCDRSRARDFYEKPPQSATTQEAAAVKRHFKRVRTCIAEKMFWRQSHGLKPGPPARRFGASE